MEPELILDYTLLWSTLEKRGEENLDFPEGFLELSREEAHSEVEQKQGQGGGSALWTHPLGEDLVEKTD